MESNRKGMTNEKSKNPEVLVTPSSPAAIPSPNSKISRTVDGVISPRSIWVPKGTTQADLFRDDHLIGSGNTPPLSPSSSPISRKSKSRHSKKQQKKFEARLKKTQEELDELSSEPESDDENPFDLPIDELPYEEEEEETSKVDNTIKEEPKEVKEEQKEKESKSSSLSKERIVTLREELDDDQSDIQGQEEKKKVYTFRSKIKVEEDHENEFKAVQIAKKPIDNIAGYCSKYINAFLNTNGGTIFFGIDDDGTILGLPLNRGMRDNVRLRIDNVVSGMKPQVDPHLVKVSFIMVEVPYYYRKQMISKRREKNKKNKRNNININSNKNVDMIDYDEILLDEYDNDDYENDEYDNESSIIDSINRYVIEVKVGKGRAPVYFTKGGSSFFRRSGSTHKMDDETIGNRILQGRPSTDPSKTVPRDFIGREEEIEKIRQFVSSNSLSISNVLTVLLFGLPVVGKSTLARRLVAEFSSKYPDVHFVIDMKGVSTHYIKSTEARITVIRSVYPSMMLPDNKNEIKGIYESCFKNKRCILLIENAGYAKQIMKLSPVSCKSCLIIVTSRKDLSLDVVMESITIRLGALKPDHAANLLLSIARIQGLDIEQAKEISRLCGYLPLPIRIVASTLNSRSSSRKLNINEFIEQLRDEDKRLEIFISNNDEDKKDKKDKKDEDKNGNGNSNGSKSSNQLLFESSFNTAFSGLSNESSNCLFAISLFHDSFDVSSASYILSLPYQLTESLLGTLLENSLLEYDDSTLRYQLNDLIRIYTWKSTIKNTDSNLLLSWKQRFIENYISILSQQQRFLLTSSRDRSSQSYRQDVRNLESCVEYAIDLYPIYPHLFHNFEKAIMNVLVGFERKRWKVVFEQQKEQLQKQGLLKPSYKEEEEDKVDNKEQGFETKTAQEQQELQSSDDKKENDQDKQQQQQQQQQQQNVTFSKIAIA